MRARRGAGWLPRALPLLLLALVGILSAGGLASAAYPSHDQYSLRNHYRIASQPGRSYPERHYNSEPALIPNDVNGNSLDVDASPQEYPDESDNSGNDIASSVQEDEPFIDSKSKDPLSNENQMSPQLGKRSSSSSLEAPSLQELLKLWGVEEPTKRPQRGDIEVTEPNVPRGDSPAGLLRHRGKRWARERDQPAGLWGFAEDDGMLMSDQASEERENYQSVKRPQEGSYPHRKQPHQTSRPSYQDNEDESRRLREQERRRIELERCRSEEAQARRDSEARRVAEERELWRKKQERRRPEEQPRRAEDERRRQEQDRYRGRNEVKQPQQHQPGAASRPEELIKAKPRGESYEERLRDWHRMKDEYERLVREQQAQPSRSRAPEELNRGQPGDSRAKSREELERERELQDYIRRNTPIVVGNRGAGHNRSSQEPPSSQRSPAAQPRPRYEQDTRRKIEECKRRYTNGNRARHDEDNEQVRREEFDRRLEDECRRRIVEEQGRRYEEERRRHGGVKERPRPSPPPSSPQPNYSENDMQRTIAPEEPDNRSKARQPVDRKRERDEARRGWPSPKEEVAPGGQPRRWDDESNRRRYLEFKKNESPAPRLPERRQQPPAAAGRDREREEEELRRLKGMPVGARIILRPGANASAPLIASRQAFGEDIDFPGLNPNRGIEAPNFPAPPTPKPPVKSPEPCVWAIVVCCGQNRRNSNQLVRCFEALNCPGASWDASTCEQRKLKAANQEIMKFYLTSRARF